MLIYIVREGDTVDEIAAAYGVAVDQIIYDNQLPYPYALAVGQALLLSEAEGISAGTDEETEGVFSPERVLPVQPPQTRRSIYVGGYAYPFVSRWVLEQTLPYLTDLFIFSYGFTAEGELIPPILDDFWMIELAQNFGVAPILTLTPFGVDGRFNNSLISAVVNDPAARERLRQEILLQMTERGYEGLDIDFEFILASDRSAFVDFVAYMREGVNALGYPVSVALAPKTSADQAGLLYEGKDYPALGAAADYVLLMTYEWGYTSAYAWYRSFSSLLSSPFSSLFSLPFSPSGRSVTACDCGSLGYSVRLKLALPDCPFLFRVFFVYSAFSRIFFSSSFFSGMLSSVRYSSRIFSTLRIFSLLLQLRLCSIFRSVSMRVISADRVLICSFNS